MKMVIWKFPLPKARNEVEMPQGAKILTIANQSDNPALWALVTKEAPTETRTFHVISTGQEFDVLGMRYLGTAHNVMGWMVLHVFEKV